MGRYTIESGRVDDGIRVILNGHVIGHQELGEPGLQLPLSYAEPGRVNTLVVILQDNAARHKYVRDLAFYEDGVMVGIAE